MNNAHHLCLKGGVWLGGEGEVFVLFEYELKSGVLGLKLRQLIVDLLNRLIQRLDIVGRSKEDCSVGGLASDE